MKKRTFVKIGIVACIGAIVAGCQMFNSAQQKHRANNLYAYLYSGQAAHVDAPTIPKLSLPLRVGIAFVPVDDAGKNEYRSSENDIFTENDKMKLLEKISGEFKKFSFVKSIEMIPASYLTPRGGFANLDQLRAIYGVDVIALVSYDQMQFTSEGIWSFSYWTIVGAYVVPGERNETKTMLDGAIYDITSRKLLFRAPGLSSVKSSATPINLDEELRLNSHEGFQIACTNLVAGLTTQLDQFKERVKQSPADFQIEYKPGYSAAGAFGFPEVVGLSGLAAGFLWTQRKQKK